jgi:hypothetical protein
MTRKPEINPSVAARLLAKRSVASRMENMTPEQRSAQARKAVHSRPDRRKPGPWYALLVFPPEYLKKGVANAVRLMDAKPCVEFYSQDKAEVVAKANSKKYRDRVTLIEEQDWNPRSFNIKRTFSTDPKAMKQMLTGGRP